LTLSWLAPSTDGGASITDYTVEQSDDGGVTWALCPSDSVSTSTSLNVTGLNQATSYSFRVSAVTSFGPGALSSVLPVSARTVPAAPGTVTASGTVTAPNVTGSGAVLAWVIPANNGGSALTDYLVETSVDNGDTWVPVTRPPSTRLGLSLKGLLPVTRYDVRVSAINVIGASTYSYGDFTTLTAAASAPQSVIASAVTSSSLTLSWSAPLTDGGASITDYKIEQSDDGGLNYVLLADSVSTSTSLNVTGLTRAKSYRFRVSAVTSFGQGKSSIRSVSTLAERPTAPGTVSVSSETASGAVLNWTAPSDNGDSPVTNYKV
jgi:titin